MFDTNAFDNLVIHWPVIREHLLCKRDNAENIELLITHIQLDEIAQMPPQKSEHAREMLELIKTISPKKIPVSAVVGVAKVGLCVVTNDEDKYDSLLNTTHSNIEDSLIGSAANRMNCSLVTDDKRFIKKLKMNSIECLCFNDFLGELGIIT